MRRAMLSIGLLLAGTSVASAQTKPLDRSQPWAAACENEITARVQKAVKSAVRVTFDADTELQWQADKGQTGVRGDGQYQMPTGGAQPFSFECMWDPHAAKITSARYTLR